MNFKLFLKYNLVIHLLIGSSLSFGGDAAFFLNSSSQTQDCIKNLEINASNIEAQIQCQKGDKHQSLQFLINTTGRSHFKALQRLNVTTFPYISNGETIGGITDISGNQTIFAVSLHLFLNHWDNKEELLNGPLQNTLPLLVSTNSGDSKYFDLILFIDNRLVNNIPLTSSPEENVRQLREILIQKIKLNLQPSLDPGLQWISPNQFSKIANDPSTAHSSGTVSQVVKKTLNKKYFTEFYLANDHTNFSTAGSSGSVIFDFRTQRPLGLLQCQIKENLINNGVEQNTQGLYKIISFDVLNEFDLYLLKDINQLNYLLSTQQITSKSIESAPFCSWRDGKGGGGL